MGPTYTRCYCYLLLLSLSGCGFLGFNHSRSSRSADSFAGEQSATVVRDSLAVPPINVYADKNAVVTLELPRTDSHTSVTTKGKNESESDSSWFSKSKLPLSIAILVGSVALIVLLIAVKLWRSASLSVNAAYSAADTGFATAINSVRNWAQTTDNHMEMAKANNLIAELEGHRGKLVRNK